MSSLALVADFLTSHWAEVVTYFRGIFCIESWFWVLFQRQLLCLGVFDSYHPFPPSWPMKTLLKVKIVTKLQTHHNSKSDPCRRQIHNSLPRNFLCMLGSDGVLLNKWGRTAGIVAASVRGFLVACHPWE